MKKILTSLAILAISVSTISPILASISNTNSQGQPNNDEKGNYKPYQAKDGWENYMNKNQAFINLIKQLAGLDASYQYQESELALETINNDKDKENQPIGTLLMNGKINTTVGSPNMASQHIIDNSEGPNPITVNYDSKTVTNTSTVSATFSVDLAASLTLTEKVDLFFASSSISATLSFDTSVSNSTTSSVEETITFDKFSTTVNPGDKVQVDYVVMQNFQVFNMVLKAKLNLDKSKFNFESNGTNKTVAWSELAKNKTNNQTFAHQLSNSLNPSEIAKGLQPLLSVDKMYDPTIPEELQFYNPNIAYIYLPLSFTIDGYSTLITQSKI